MAKISDPNNIINKHRRFYQMMKINPEMNDKDLIYYLTYDDLFSKTTAILWINNRFSYYEKSLRCLRKSKFPTRKFLSRIYEMSLLFSTVNVFSDMGERYLKISEYDEDSITVMFPDIYDKIIHQECTKISTGYKTRFRFWSDFKYSILTPIRNRYVYNQIKRTFTLPSEFINHPYSRLLLKNKSSQHIFMELLGELFINYLGSIINFEDFHLLIDNKNHKILQLKKFNYESCFEEIIKRKLKEMDFLLINFKSLELEK